MVDARDPVGSEPLSGRLPDQLPEAVQAVASVELHVSVEPAPLAMVLGLALRLTVGAGTTVMSVDASAEPPSPVQLIMKVVVEVIAPVD
ncbi:MAG TPA: hypothetical protein VN676_15520 [Steroidobacteraceae bacterium]|nr:hypothetical protein [Steroidobacteraceae bacterium]